MKKQKILFALTTYFCINLLITAMKSSEIINLFEQLMKENVTLLGKGKRPSYEEISRYANLEERTMYFHYRNTHVSPLDLLLVFYVDTNSAKLYENGVLTAEFLNISDEEMREVPFQLHKNHNLLAAFWFYDRQAYPTSRTEEAFNKLPDNEMKNKIIAKYEQGDYYVDLIYGHPNTSNPIEIV